MDFKAAANIIKSGGRVKRVAWKQSPSAYRNNGFVQYRPRSNDVWYLNYDCWTCMMYQPSWEDIYADDWVEEESTKQVEFVSKLYCGLDKLDPK